MSAESESRKLSHYREGLDMYTRTVASRRRNRADDLQGKEGRLALDQIFGKDRCLEVIRDESRP